MYVGKQRGWHDSHVLSVINNYAQALFLLAASFHFSLPDPNMDPSSCTRYMGENKSSRSLKETTALSEQGRLQPNCRELCGNCCNSRSRVVLHLETRYAPVSVVSYAQDKTCR